MAVVGIKGASVFRAVDVGVIVVGARVVGAGGKVAGVAVVGVEGDNEL